MQSLVSPEWLAAALDQPNLIVLDATRHLPGANRDAAAEFADSHIRGARYFDLAQLVDETSSVPMACPRPEQLSELLAQSGVSQDDTIIFYCDSAVKTSARAWFLCRENGLRNVAILDGGLAKWKADGHPMESGEPKVTPTTPMDLSSQGRIRFKQDMLANIEQATEQVLDARDQGRFAGNTVDNVHGQPTGHIPGSLNLPFPQLFQPDGTYRSTDDLRDIFAKAGIDLEMPVTTTCGSGVTASALLFAMHMIGKDDTALYDGSWLDWGSDPTTPNAVEPNENGKAG